MTLIEIADYLETSLPKVNTAVAKERYTIIIDALRNYVDIKNTLDEKIDASAEQVPATHDAMHRNYIIGKNNAYHEIVEFFKYEK